MRILLVEDDENFLKDFLPHLKIAAGGSSTIVVAKSRKSAIDRIAGEVFDLFLLDLKIPTNDGGLDPSVSHGRSVFHEARRYAPRTPILFLTGSSADEMVDDVLRHAEQEDVWGDRKPISTIQIYRKSNLDEALRALADLSQRIALTDQIEIRPKVDSYSREQRRVLRTFARRRNGASCVVAPLSGGLSASRVVRVTVLDGSGVEQIQAVGKLGTLTAVEDEVERFNRDVPRLSPGAFPQLVEVVRGGAGLSAGAFYRLAETFDDTLFSSLKKSGADIPTLVGHVSNLTIAWRVSLPEVQKSIGDVRRRLLGDDKTREIAATYAIDWIADLEERPIQVRWGCVHGDLHGGNVLVGQRMQPILIDFGDIGHGPACLDAITLELSAIFHPSHAAECGEWPTPEQAAGWCSVERYTAGSPISAFVLACRSWATQVAAGDREMLAAAYAYVLRQLKYEGTRKDVALALLDAIRAELVATYAE
jgi:CheY-like chemotaxis protein